MHLLKLLSSLHSTINQPKNFQNYPENQKIHNNMNQNFQISHLSVF